jgi:hypothetical protein
MDVKEINGKLIYHYTIKKGISKIQGAFSILEDMNYPEEIMKSIRESV